jgi:hypothetical protein
VADLLAFSLSEQRGWFAGVEGAFRHFGGITEEVLLDKMARSWCAKCKLIAWSG